MVKGSSKRVVVVDSPDRRFFEQAIFIVRSDAEKQGVTAAQLVEEARQVAKSYAGGGHRRRGRSLGRRWSGLAWAALGGGVMGLVWLAATVFL